MAWSMPPTGPWAPGIGVTPDMNMGTYTAEQWAAMQQQNWQQWAQWQQQYASWQSQYGSKYAEQMQAMQTMGTMPPLPPTNTAPPPAPPPPDKPPPPPHENNQPLYGHLQQQPISHLQQQPVSHLQQQPVSHLQQQPVSHLQQQLVSHLQQQPVSHSQQQPVPQLQQQPVLQMQQQPVPHSQQQLVSHLQQQLVPVLASGQNSAPPNNSTETTGNNQNRPQATDTCPENSVNSEALKTLAEEQKAFDIQFQQWEEEFEKWKIANINHPDKKAYKEYEQTFEACKTRLLERRLQMKQKKARLMNNTPQVAINSAPRINVPPAVPPPTHNTSSATYLNNEQPGYPPLNYNKNFPPNPQFSNMTQHYYRENSNKNFEPQDRQESYSKSSTSNNINSSNLIPTEPFLPTSEPPKGIPGLDLVPEADKFANKAHEVIDITDDPMDKQFRSNPQGPDYSKISKGINNILGDETIMNILSMVRGQGPPPSNPPMNNQRSYGPTDSGNNRPNNYIGRIEPYNTNYGAGQNQNLPHAKQASDYTMQQENNQGSKYSTPPPRLYQNRTDPGPPNQYHERNQQYKSQGLLPRPGMQQNVKPNITIGSLLDPIQPQSDYASGGLDTRGMQDEVHPQQHVVPVRLNPNVRPKWVEDPLFTPSIIVEYEHKPLRLKARDFIEPVHTFDYNHKSKDSDVRKKDFEKEAEELFTRQPRMSDREDRYSSDRQNRDLFYRNKERASNKDMRDFQRDESHSRGYREVFDDRRRFDEDMKDRRFEDRRRDDRDKYYRRDDMHRDRDREDMFRERERDLERIRTKDRERDMERNRDRDNERSRDRDRERGLDHGRDKDMYRDRNRDFRRSRSREKDNRKRGLSRDSELSNSSSKKLKETSISNNTNGKPKHTVMIDDILELPGRQMRPEKIVIILRGPPGSGKSYLAKLIRDREAEQGGTVRVMSIDDYFMQEGEIEEKDPVSGKIVKKPSLQYEYDEKLEESYLTSLKRAFKRSLTDGYFTFLIYDAVNDQLRSYADIWNFSRQNGFQVYICTMDLDPQTCYKRNIHNRKLEEVQVICSRFFPTPNHHIQMDPTTLLQNASIPEVQMEDADDDITMEDAQDSEVNNCFTSKWEKMDDAEQLARLDGTSRPLRPSQLSMEDYLQLDDWKPNASKPGKKTVRWADIEERRRQEKMRAIGFVVGQTDWNRMTDPTMGSGALTQTKYIERVRRT